MIKIFIAFVVFAALAMFMLMKGGDIYMSGEKHGSEATHSEPAKPEAPAAPAGAASKP